MKSASETARDVIYLLDPGEESKNIKLITKALTAYASEETEKWRAENRELKTQLLKGGNAMVQRDVEQRAELDRLRKALGEIVEYSKCKVSENALIFKLTEIARKALNEGGENEV